MNIIKKLFISDRLFMKLEQLYGVEKAPKEATKLAGTKCSIFISAIMISGIIAAFCTFCMEDTTGGEITSITRNNYGEGDKQVSISVSYGDIEEDISLIVKEKQYTEDMIEDYARNFEQELPNLIKGKNESLDNIVYDMKLVSSYEKYPFTVSWKTDRPMLLDSKGILNHEEIGKCFRDETDISGGEKQQTIYQGIPINLCAQIEYVDFYQDIYLSVLLGRTEESREERFGRRFEEELDKQDIFSKYSDERNLPVNVDGVNIKYYAAKENKGLIVIILGLIVAFGLAISGDKEIDKKIEHRNRQLERDYAGILEQYSLYYCAGLSHRHIWAQICSKYKSRREKGGETRYAFEEMLITDRKIKEGVGDILAYDEFAKRCQGARYRVFVSCIEQSLRKGSDKLENAFRDEADKARRDNLNRIKKDAQELTTKLLAPMLMMLVVVLIVVMVPAFINFGM